MVENESIPLVVGYNNKEVYIIIGSSKNRNVMIELSAQEALLAKYVKVLFIFLSLN